MSEPDRWQDLIDAAEKDEAERETAATRPRARSRNGALGIALVASLATLVISWHFLGPVRQGPDTGALESGRKIALLIAASRVQEFKARNGRYPEALKEAMPVDMGLGYRKLDDGFELTADLPDGKLLVVKER